MGTVLKSVIWSVLIAVLSMWINIPVACAKENGNFSIYVGGVNSDFGGESSTGLSVGVVGFRVPVVSNFRFQFGAEYVEKRNSGQVSRSSSADGSLMFEGLATVSLKYIHFYSEFQYVEKISNVAISPYVGLGFAPLLSQSISTNEPSGNSFKGFDWYHSTDALTILGVEIAYRRVLLDFQFSQGLVKMKSSKERAEGEWPGNPFTDSSQKSQSFRVAGGISF